MSTERSTVSALYRLLAWLSPSFPIGAFSYSHGLEAAAAGGAVRDRASLEIWIAAIVVHGSGRMDADVLRDAYSAALAGDDAALYAANRRGLAYRATAELALESAQQGEAFLITWLAAWHDERRHQPLDRAKTGQKNPSPPFGGRGQGDGGNSGDCIVQPPHPNPLPPQAWGEGDQWGAFSGGVCLPVAFAAAATRAGIELQDALLGYLQAFAANLVSAGLRLGIIGQTDGQRILAALEPVVAATAEAALSRDPADFGSATFAVDIASMTHETQYSRLFRS